MKLFTVFAAVVAVAVGSYSPITTWTLAEIEAALQDPSTDPAIIPYLTDGLNTIVSNLHAGLDGASVILSMPVEQTVTVEELTAAIHDPSTNPAFLPYYESALQDLMVAMINGQEEDTIVLSIPAMSVNLWTQEQLSAALQNPETDPELMVYLEFAMNQLIEELFAGGQAHAIAVITPPGVIASAPETPAPVVVEPGVNPTPVIVVPVFPTPVIPTPVIPTPVIPTPVIPTPVIPTPVIPTPVIPTPVIPTPVIPTPVVSETPVVVASAPLVQLIINVNAKMQEAVAATPVVNPAPVAEPSPVVVPTPVVTPEGPQLAVNPAGWAPVGIANPLPEAPAIAVRPWARRA